MDAELPNIKIIKSNLLNTFNFLRNTDMIENSKIENLN